MAQLTAADYEKVLKFSSYICKDFDHFIPNVLYALEEFFGIRLSAYAIFNKNAQGNNYVDSIHSNTVLPETLMRYQSGMFLTDLFHQRLPAVANSGKGKYVYTITDIGTYEEFYATEYGSHQRSVNLPYQAVIRGTRRRHQPSHVLNLFKSGQDGDFNEYEKELLDRIGHTYSDAVELYKSYLENTNYSRFLDHLTQTGRHGMAIVNEQNQVVYSNDYFLRTASTLFNTEGIYSAIISLFAAFTAQAGTAPDSLLQTATITIYDFTITISPERIFNGETLQKYLFISLRGQGTGLPDEENEDYHVRFSADYGFTLRESEIASLLLEGCDNAQIAATLCINISTVKFHVKNIFRKLGVGKRSAAIVKLIR